MPQECPKCGCDELGEENSSVYCLDCGFVMAESVVVNEQTFSESGGASVADGQWVGTGSTAP